MLSNEAPTTSLCMSLPSGGPGGRKGRAQQARPSSGQWREQVNASSVLRPAGSQHPEGPNAVLHFQEGELPLVLEAAASSLNPGPQTPWLSAPQMSAFFQVLPKQHHWATSLLTKASRPAPSTSGWRDNAHNPGPTSWITHCAAPPRCQGAQGRHADHVPQPQRSELAKGGYPKPQFKC